MNENVFTMKDQWGYVQDLIQNCTGNGQKSLLKGIISKSLQNDLFQDYIEEQFENYTNERNAELEQEYISNKVFKSDILPHLGTKTEMERFKSSFLAT